MILDLDPQTATKLKHVKLLSPLKGAKGIFPDFLIVGPQRTASTWLEVNLRLHPEIFTAFPKEIHFFNRLVFSDRNHHSLDYYNINWNLLLRKPRREMQKLLRIIYFDYLVTGRANATQLDWYLSYFNDKLWVRRRREKKFQSLYGEFFRPKVFGEATASYSTLHPEVIEDILLINPNIKIILMVRDPVSRAWSHAKKDLMRARNRKFKEVPEEEFINFFYDSYQLKCADYSGNIQRWQGYLGSGNLYVGFFDDVQKKPEEMLLKVFSFLGVSTDTKYIRDTVRKKINPTEKVKIPKAYQDLLQGMFKEEKIRLKEVYGRTWV